MFGFTRAPPNVLNVAVVCTPQHPHSTPPPGSVKGESWVALRNPFGYLSGNHTQAPQVTLAGLMNPRKRARWHHCRGRVSFDGAIRPDFRAPTRTAA